MDDFADRTINELVESYPLFLEALKDEYDILFPMINIIFSSCGIIKKTEENGRTKYEAFDCFFEYQIYKIMEKYTYYNQIRHQLYIIEYINEKKIQGNLKLKSFIDRNLYKPYRPDIPRWLFINYERNDDTIEINFEGTLYRIKVEDKYKQDMLNLLEHN